jgi:hypothetical protein
METQFDKIGTETNIANIECKYHRAVIDKEGTLPPDS